MRTHARLLAALVSVGLAACPGPESPSTLSIDYEKYELANGLDVVLHVDRSDPVAAVAMTFHVGSAREEEGKTGFAHLFEHLFFLDSENLGPGGLDRLMTKVGSSTNGSTSRDRTNYFEVVPIDGLEKALWAESDKLGYFINTVTPAVLAKEQQVVKNEKRQGVDNRPYGHVSFVIDRALYPPGHPYRWQVIGSLEDLDAATLEDARAFHSRWYGPDNATLVVAGDLDVEQTKAWIERYFGEIPAAGSPESRPLDAVALETSRRFLHEDNFANLPQLTVAWPTVRIYEADSYPLELLAALLADGKSAPLYEVVVEEEKLAPAVTMFNSSQELAGQLTLRIRAFRDTDLDAVQAAVDTAMARFEERGISAADLERVKAGYETSFYAGLSSTLRKAFQLAQYNIFAGSPGYVEEDIERILAVSEVDVMRVYEAYVKNRPFVAASFVPRGQPELALEGSEPAEVVEEPIVQGAERGFELDDRDEIERTASSFDRSAEPLFGEAPRLKAPEVWRETLPNGLAVLGIEDEELPLVRFELRLKGGLLLESADRVGAANLLAETMTEGTVQRTPKELEQAIEALGASISVRAERESLVLSGRSLARNFVPTMALVEEILLEPRWDPDEFELARNAAANELRRRAANPANVAQDVFYRLLYGDHILGANPIGTIESIEAMGVAELESYRARAFAPRAAAFHVSGGASREQVVESLGGIATRWESRELAFPEPPSTAGAGGLYFVDVPGAKQSVLYIGYLALPATDPEFYPAEVVNFRLGGGGFASDLLEILREQKGYTYGISSSFQGTDLPGPFAIRSSVRSNVTYEALALVKEIVERHGPTFDEEDLEATRSYLLKSNALAFETLSDKLGILSDMSAYGFPADYVLQRETIVREMTIERARELAARYLDPARMLWLVVGDAETQLARLGGLGLGEPVLVDRSGSPIEGGAAGR